MSSNSASRTLTGKILLASPTLRDGIFHRSVILVAKHSEQEGAMGLILNQPSTQAVGDLISEEVLSPLANLPVYVGGPVGAKHLSFSALWVSQKGRFRYIPQISGDDALKRNRQPGTLVRAFVGYSGWSAGQLEDELEQNSWMVIDVPDTLLGMTHDQSLWAETLRGLSPFHQVLAEFPDQPELN